MCFRSYKHTYIFANVSSSFGYVSPLLTKSFNTKEEFDMFSTKAVGYRNFKVIGLSENIIALLIIMYIVNYLTLKTPGRMEMEKRGG